MERFGQYLVWSGFNLDKKSRHEGRTHIVVSYPRIHGTLLQSLYYSYFVFYCVTFGDMSKSFFNNSLYCLLLLRHSDKWMDDKKTEVLHSNRLATKVHTNRSAGIPQTQTQSSIFMKRDVEELSDAAWCALSECWAAGLKTLLLLLNKTYRCTQESRQN